MDDEGLDSLIRESMESVRECDRRDHVTDGLVLCQWRLVVHE